MVRKSPRKKPLKRLNNEVPAVQVKIEPAEVPEDVDLSAQHESSSALEDDTFQLPLRIKLNLQKLTTETKKKPAPPKIKTEPLESDIPPYVPPHMLGRDLTDPLADVIHGSNRSLQKPRVGVKVPNRNLTSPILSHSELNKELLARSRMRRPVVYDDEPQYGDAGCYLFSLKMVSRLAGSMPSKCFPLKLNPTTLKLTLNTNRQLLPKMDAALEKELALKQLKEMKVNKRKSFRT